MSDFEAELKKTVKTIIKIEQDKQIQREKELDAYYHIASIRIGCKKPRCYC